jgi:MFS transporter, PHS family, inorganic phosphate transporter
VEWHKDHPDALLDDMQLFLRTQCGLEVSLPTISRQVRKANGGAFLRSGRCERIRSRKQREAEGRSIALELQHNAGEPVSDQAAAPDMYHHQRQLPPLEQILAPQQHETAEYEQGAAYQEADGQQYQVGITS